MVEYLGVFSSTVFACFSLNIMTWYMKTFLLGKMNTLWSSTEKGWSGDKLLHRNHFGSCHSILLLSAAAACCSQLKAIVHWHHNSAGTCTHPSCHHRCMCAFPPLLLIPWDLPKTSHGKWKQWSPTASMRKKNIWRTCIQYLSPPMCNATPYQAFLPKETKHKGEWYRRKP